MMTSLSEDDEIISDLEEETISFNKEEILALLRECYYSYISYENPTAINVIRRMIKFAHDGN